MAHGLHSHADARRGDTRVAWAIAINMGLTVAQVAGGVLAGSLALIADALHNFSDAVALIIAYLARRIARQPADGRMTFGYGRIEPVAALVNYTTLVVIGLYLIYEAVLRLANPAPVAGWIIVLVAGVALAVDLGTAALTWRLSRSSTNIRAAFLHNLADALGSVAVILAGTIVLLWGWTWVDPAATLLIAGYILWQSLREMPGVVRILMLGSPPDIDTRQVIDAVSRVPGVASLHHVHVWMMGEHEPALDAHVVLDDGAAADEVRRAIRRIVADRYDIRHTTLETENGGDACAEPTEIRH